MSMVDSTPSEVRPRAVRESFRPGAPGFWVHPEWEISFPWLAQGTTGGSGRGSAGGRDFALFTDASSPSGRASWEILAARLGFPGFVCSRQVHGRSVWVHREGTRECGANEPQDADGHATDRPEILLGVTVADCVPVFLVEPGSRTIGLLHAGWRGAAAGIMEEGIHVLRTLSGASSRDLHLHLGPSICGACYEVGPEVHEALGLSRPAEPEPVDLRAILASRALEAGVPNLQISRSSWCTLCGGSPFYSHRRGDGERQVGFLGIRTSQGDGKGSRGVAT